MKKRSATGPLAAALLLLIAVAVTTLLTTHLGRQTAGVTPAPARGGARELEFMTIDGAPWRLHERRGRVVAVNLWAMWCGPCREETPMLNRVSQELEGRGFEMLGVSLDTRADKAAAVRGFRAAYHVRYPLAFPEAMSQIEAGLDGVPTTLLFDREGRAAKIYVGAVREQTLREDVETLLREP